jgi:peptidoglycan/LPS O-acetylase OafA/YrhL
MTTARNIAIVVALAAIVFFVPGGGDGADLVAQVLTSAFTVAIALFLGRMYLQMRTDIFGLGDRWRAAFYCAIGVLMLTLAASHRLFDTGAGALAWFALVGGASYTLYLVWRQHRAYG